MRTVEISRRSWHYRLMEAFDMESRYAGEICAYLRWLAFAVVLSAMLATFTSFVFGGVLLYGALELYVWLLYDIEPGLMGQCLVGVLILGSTFGAMFGLLHLHKSEYDPALRVPLPTFAASALESARDRVCFRVTRVE